ncbi:MAG: FAD-dependent oxidoreductase [Thermomicrobiales bacterium]
MIGGGIAGLSAALTLQDAGVDVVLIESSDRLGGKIRTERTGDYIIEVGSDSILSYKPAGLAMIERVGLMDRVINTREGGQGTSILHRGRLQPLPEGMTGLVPADVRSIATTGLLPWRGLSGWRSSTSCRQAERLRTRASADSSGDGWGMSSIATWPSRCCQESTPETRTSSACWRRSPGSENRSGSTADYPQHARPAPERAGPFGV